MVTLLFADLSGYTSYCQSKDPEDVHLRVRPLMNALRAVCEDVGGIVPSIEGDGFMAVFGAVHASERDPALGLHAAVVMQRLVRERLANIPDLPGLHIGLHVGEVIVAPSWEASGIALSGDPVNVASRLSGQAQAGRVVASRDLVELSGVDRGWGPVREVELKGRVQPVAVQEFDWVAAGPEIVPSHRWTRDAAYVSRPRIEAQIGQALEGRGALLVGEAGSGKSRLVEAAVGTRIVVACSPTRQMLARDVLAAALEASGAEERVLERLVRGASEDYDEEDRLTGSGALLPPGTIVVVEDAERLADDEAELLGAAIAGSPGRWLVVSRRALPLGLPTIDVGPLTEQEATDLLSGLLPGASERLTEVLLTRAGDSPLFLEQCARFLLESGAVEIHDDETQVVRHDELSGVPTSMRLFVSGRLDLLSPRLRQVLEVAAVLGDGLDPALLEKLVGDPLESIDELVERRFLRRAIGPGLAVKLEFTHALVRDVTYQTQLRQRRAAYHRAAADWYAVLPTVHVLEQQAFHLEQAVVLGDSDCAQLREAVAAMVLYARSIERERPRVAHGALVRARALADSRSECQPDLLHLEVSWATVSEIGGDEVAVLSAVDRGLALAASRNDDLAQAELRLVRARTLGPTQPVRAREDVDLAAGIYDAREDVAGSARVAVERAWIRAVSEGTAAMLEDLERAFALSMRGGDARVQAQTAQTLALQHALNFGVAGFDEWAQRARAVGRADDVGLEAWLALAESCLGSYGLDISRGLTASHRALSAGRELGIELVHLNALSVRVDLLLVAGQLAEARTLISQGRSASQRRQSERFGLDLDVLEARLLQRDGHVSGADALIAAYLANPVSQETVMIAPLLSSRAEMLLERGCFAEAADLAGQSVALQVEAGEQVITLRGRALELIANTAGRQRVTLNAINELRAFGRSSGLPIPAALVARFALVDELTRGYTVDMFGLDDTDGLIEGEALDLEISALSSRTWSILLEAADTWARLGDTVWQARALLWHSELTGEDHPEAAELLSRLQSPEGLEQTLRAQVAELRA